MASPRGEGLFWCFTAKKPLTFRSMAFGPSGESRTHGLLNPIQARYQTALHPDVTHCDGYYYTPLNCQMSTFSFTKMQNDCFVSPGWAILNAYNSRFHLSANPPVRHSAGFSKFTDFSVQKKPLIFQSMAFGPSGESRTHGLLNPIQARYQTALHPDVTRSDRYYYSTHF